MNTPIMSRIAKKYPPRYERPAYPSHAEDSANAVAVEQVGVCYGVTVRGKIACVRLDLPSAERVANQIRSALAH